jgi:hypothetical protein
MLSTPPTPRGTDPAARATPTPGVEVALDLPAQTVAWLAEHPHDRTFVRSVWDTLTEWEHAGQQPEPLAALRSVLLDHQPTPAGRCRVCRRFSWRHLWRRRRFPCIVWHQIHGGLFGLFPCCGRHRQPITRT